MMRRLLAVLVSSACLWTGIPASASAAAEGAEPVQASAPDPAAGKGNQPPLPPGPAVDLTKAQGYDNLGPGVIIASVAGATALLFLMMFADDDDDDDDSPTGTN